MHQRDVDHRAFINDQQIALERAFLVALEAERLRVDFQHAVDGLCLHARRFFHPFGSPPGRGAQQQRDRLRRQDLQDRVDDGGLADAGAAGDHHDLGAKRKTNGLGLARGEGQTGFLFDPGERLVGINLWPGTLARDQMAEPVGDTFLCVIEPTQEDAGGIRHRVGNHGALGQFQVDCRLDQIVGNLEQFGGLRDQLRKRQAAVTVAHRFGQGIGNPGAHTDHGGLFDPEFLGDQIRRSEPDAANVPREAVGVLAHHLHGVDAVGLEDAHGPRGSDPMAVQKHHDLADDFLIGPGGRDLVSAFRSDALDFPQSGGLGLDQIEHVLAEHLDHPFGVHRSDTPDHAGAEVFLDAIQRRGRGGLQEPCAELQAVGVVIGPVA